MQNKTLYILGLLIAVCGPPPLGIESQTLARRRPGVEVFVGQDLHLRGLELISHRLNSGEHTLVFGNGFSMSIGANQFSSGSAVVWLGSLPPELVEKDRPGYQAILYLQGSIS